MFMNTFTKDAWVVSCNGHEFLCLGYEQRGIFHVPIADFDLETGDAICSTVYSIYMGFRQVEKNDHISLTRPNKSELAILDCLGLCYNHGFIERK